MPSRARKVVVDSDVLIQVLRGDEAIAAAMRGVLSSSVPMALTPVTVAEVLARMRKREETRTRIFLEALDCLKIDRTVGERAGQFVALYGRSHSVELADALVAACAVVHGYQLWTLNQKHYPMSEVRHFSPTHVR